MLTKSLLICGILASLLYVASDILAALSWEGYSYSGHSVSELRALAAPTRPMLLPLLFLYSMLELAFGLGVCRASAARPVLRRVGVLLVALGLLDLLAPLFPMHARGAATTVTDAMHIALTVLTVILFVLILWFAAAAAGPWFRIYTWATLTALIVFGVWAFMDGPRIAAGLPTPWMGIRERINIYSYMLWMLVLAGVLLASAPEVVRTGTAAEQGRKTT